MIEAREVTKRFGDTVVVDGVSLSLPRGGITSLIGPNGAGKSTLLGMISRLLPLDAGTASVDGLDIARTPSDALARRLSILRQDNHITARLTVRELVAFGRYPHTKGRTTAEDAVHVDRAIAYLELGDFAGRYLDELSGGQRQRAFVAMVLAQDTDYMLLDEPLNNLDMRHARAMMTIMRRAASELGKSVVVVLHDINFAAWHSDRIVAMRDGRVRHVGPPSDIIRPEILRDIYDIDIEVIETAGRRVCLFYE